MPYKKVPAAACAILVILGLLMLRNIGTYGISSNQVQIASSGSIYQPPIANSVVTNGNFNNGLTGWRGESGWSNPSTGFAFIDTGDGHDSAPCLKLENDPYGVGITDNDVGDSGSVFQGWNVVPGQMVHIRYWAKTDSDGSHSFGLRCGWDGGTANAGQPDDNYAGPAIAVINCTVPIITSCPTVAWGTSSWTLVEVYGTVRSGVYSMNLWIQAWNGGLPSTRGTIGTGTDFAAAYVDDVFVSIT
ncbi:MAG: hypothetical protein ABR962_00430 [Candidatus Bathyarchaeia archaeon]